MLLIHKKIFREDRLVHIALVLSILQNFSTILMRSNSTSNENAPLFGQQDQFIRQYLSSLPPDELRNLISSQNPTADQPSSMDHWRESHLPQHHDMGGLLGQSHQHHLSRTNRINNYNRGYLHNDFPVKYLEENLRKQERDNLWNRLNALSIDSVNAWLNGIGNSDDEEGRNDASQVDSENADGDNQKFQDLSRDDSEPRTLNPSTCGSRQRLPYTRGNLNTFVTVGISSVIPNSTSTTLNRENILGPLVNPTPPPTPPPEISSASTSRASESSIGVSEYPRASSSGANLEIPSTPPMSPPPQPLVAAVGANSNDSPAIGNLMASSVSTQPRRRSPMSIWVDNWLRSNTNNIFSSPMMEEYSEEVSERSGSTLQYKTRFDARMQIAETCSYSAIMFIVYVTLVP